MWRVSVFIIILLVVICFHAIQYGVLGKVAIGLYLTAALISIPVIWDLISWMFKKKPKYIYQIPVVLILIVLGFITVGIGTKLSVASAKNQASTSQSTSIVNSEPHNALNAATMPIPGLTESEKKAKVDKEQLAELISLNESIGNSNAYQFSGSRENIELYARVMNQAAMAVHEANFSFNVEIVKARKQLEKTLKKRQLADLPVLRKKWAKLFLKALLEQDVEVRVSGKRNTMLTLTGVVYASNSNIKWTQETLSSSLHLLRFKRVNYKWYEYDDEYTYYNVKSAYDAILLK